MRNTATDSVVPLVWGPRLAALCGGIAAVTGMLVLVGWWLDVPALKSVIPGTVSMKANTALAFVLAGAALALSTAPISPRRARTGRSLGLIAALIGGLTLCEFIFGWQLGIDELLFRDTPDAAATLIPGRMAPSTAVNFLLLGLALPGIEWEPRRGFRPAEILALVAAIVSLISIAEYAIDQPILYGFGQHTRMALHSAAGFIVLSGGLLLARPAQGMIGALRAGQVRPLLRATYLTLALIFLAVSVGGAWLYRAQEQEARDAVESGLETIALLKVNQIVQWRAERLGDAAVLADSEFFAEGVKRWMAAPQAELAEKILLRFGAMHRYNQYGEILLTDTRGKVHLSFSGRAGALHPEEGEALATAVERRRPVLSDLHLGPDDRAPHLSSIAPIFDRTGAAPQLIGTVVLTIHAQSFLYPLIQSWPTASRSAETYLVRREGDAALFLNDSRHRPDTALKLRIALSQRQVPEVMAILGSEGVFRGEDYRGVKVLSVLRAIPGSTWFMVTKIDEAEALAEWHYRARLIVAVIATLLLVLTAATLILWQQRDKDRTLARSADALRKANRAYQVLSECNQTLVHATSEPQLVDRICALLVEHGGYRCAWVGYADDDAQKSVRPVAQHGFDEGYVENLQLSWADTERGRCPSDVAIRTGQYCIARNVHGDADYALWREGAARHGYASSISLPLKFNGPVGGVLSIYTADPEAFDPQEIALLTEMANDLAFGIRTLRSQAARRKSEEALRASESRYRRLFESAKDGILILDAETGMIVDANPFITGLLGYSLEDCLGKHIWDLRSLKNVAASKEKFLELQQQNYVRYEDLPLENAQGQTIQVEFVSNVYLVDDTRVIQCNIRDITERKRAEAELALERNKVAAAFDNVDIGLVVSDAQGGDIFMNAAALEFHGFTSAEDMIRRIEGYADDWELHYPDGRIMPFNEWPLPRATRGNYVHNYDTDLRNIKTGHNWACSYTSAPVRDSAGEVVLIIMTLLDITERKRAEQDIWDLNVSLERRVAERTQQFEEASRAKSDFLANMSHELRTPLNSIIGFSEMLKDGVLGELGTKQRGFVNDIFGAGTHLLSLINDILDLSKVEAGMLQLEAGVVDVPALLKASTLVVREKALAHRIRLDTELDPGLGAMLADERKLKQIVYNLLSNAVKFSADGGAVTLHARRCARAEVALDATMPGRLLPLPPGEDGEFLAIAVEDSGVGIAEEDLPKLFEPFMQVDSSVARRHAGTGLGLSLVRRLAELHGGTVGVASRLGAGSRFCVWLPYRAAEPAAEVGQTELSGTAPAAPMVPLALVIEDDDRMAELITAQLRAEGFAVMRAATAEEGLVRAAKRRPQLITLDIFLPNMDGWEFMRRLKAEPKLADTPVVIITVSDDLERGLTLGARRVLQKPFVHEELVAALAGLFDARPDGEPARVLVVDDNVKAVELVATALEAEGYRVMRAYGGAEAIRVARSALPDLVILDLIMPEVSGFEVARALRDSGQTARIPILVLTAKDLSAEDHARLNGDVSAILAKTDFSAGELLAELRRALPKRGAD